MLRNVRKKMQIYSISFSIKDGTRRMCSFHNVISRFFPNVKKKLFSVDSDINFEKILGTN